MRTGAVGILVGVIEQIAFLCDTELFAIAQLLLEHMFHEIGELRSRDVNGQCDPSDAAGRTFWIGRTESLRSKHAVSASCEEDRLGLSL